MRTIIAWGLVLAALAGCVSDTDYTPFEPSTSAEATAQPSAEPAMPNAEESPAANETIVDDPVDKAPLRFLIIGDQGSGSSAQYDVGQAMVAACADRGCDFVMTTGDNIYDVGAITAYDPAFEEKFELPYAGMDVPFYLSLGNHDNGFIGTFTELGDAQVAYSQREDRSSDKWNMPARYYSQKFGDDLEIFALDSDSIQRTDATNMDADAPEVQQAWLRDQIDASNATWKIAFGHYNYISNGNYGDGSAAFKEALEASICDRVQFYAQGHDHDLQWLKPVDSCGRTEIIGSSAASKARPVTDATFDARFADGDLLGFAWVEIIGETFRLQFIDVDGQVLHDETVTKAGLGWAP